MFEQLEALCHLLESDGHMTPVATRQILKAVGSSVPVVFPVTEESSDS